jgi:hypothetical protein
MLSILTASVVVGNYAVAGLLSLATVVQAPTFDRPSTDLRIVNQNTVTLIEAKPSVEPLFDVDLNLRYFEVQKEFFYAHA